MIKDFLFVYLIGVAITGLLISLVDKVSLKDSILAAILFPLFWIAFIDKTIKYLRGVDKED